MTGFVTNQIFVYGTLIGGRSANNAWPVDSGDVQPACVTGLLFDLGPYPAMVAASGGDRPQWVLGEVHSIRPDALQMVLASLDAFEEFIHEDDPANLYSRRLIQAHNSRGSVSAWAYYLQNANLLVECDRTYRRIMPDVDFEGRRCASWTAYMLTKRTMS